MSSLQAEISLSLVVRGTNMFFVVQTCHPESLDKRDYFPLEILVDRTVSQIVPQQTNNETHKAAASTWREIYGRISMSSVPH